MNREIKFRAWDRFNAEMINWADCNGNKKDLSWFFSQIEDREKDHNDLMLMQYTGLKDKNGKEIYEGDILIHKLSNPIKLIVRHHSSMYGSGLRLEEDDGRPYKGSTGLYYEVIGNIHENPDLL